MGSVWIADHLALGTQVAVKLMMPEYATDAEFVERFQQEAKAAARIRSPHVVHMIDSGVTADGSPFIVMELLEGETLGSRIRRLGPLPLRDVVRIIVQAANALGSAHRLGIVHRDIKPDNLFLIEVGGEPFVKVLDFGLAKQPRGTLHLSTDAGRVMGTPLYMSPEQLVSSKYVDHRTDVWALAAIAYEALTARQPFQGESIFAQVLAVHGGGFSKPSTIRPGLPEAVDAWAVRALQKDPDARFGSARELADALEAAMAAEVAPAPRSSGPSASALAATDPRAPATGAHQEEQPIARPHVEVVSASRLPVAMGDTPQPPGEQRSGPFVEPSFHSVDGTLVSGGSAVPELDVGAGRIRIILGDLVTSGAEALVNTTDSMLSGSGGLDAQIHSAAGPDLEKELLWIGDCPEGSAVITGAGRMPPPTRFIIHAVGPTYSLERADECAALLWSAHGESLRLAEANDVHEVAFPAISTGTHGYPVGAAAPIAVAAAVDHLTDHARSVTRIVFVLETTGHFAVFSAALAASASVVATRPRG
jgi:serine/threonine-protein kinase